MNPAVPKRKWRLPVRFSLASMLLLAALLSVTFSHLLYYIRSSATIRRLDAERLTMREELGYLEIQDDKKAYVRQLGSMDPLTWRYRVYLPEGTHRVCVALEWVSDGFPRHVNTARAFSGGQEFILTAGFRRGADGDWVLRTAMPWGASHVPDKWGELAWLTNELAHTSPPLTANQRAFAPDQRIEITRCQAWRFARGKGGDPSDGFMVWIEPKRPGIPFTTSLTSEERRRKASAEKSAAER
jgi:hypothetical protein